MSDCEIRCFTKASSRLTGIVREFLETSAVQPPPRKIVIKPNWVLHETDPAFPIRALVTDSRLVEATVEACLDLFPAAESILVGDCPLQWADWPLMCRQSALQDAMDRLVRDSAGRVAFRDLRREVYVRDRRGFLVQAEGSHGDPRGYREVALGSRSHLEPLSKQAKLFAVNDYCSSVTSSNHAPGQHSYLVCQSVLDADLFINLPKWKCHQKSAVTGALKNLVGINGDKAYLPHFRRGAPRWGGDEYSDDQRWLYWLQTTLRAETQKRSRLLYQLLKPGWEALKYLRGIKTRLENPGDSPKSFYLAGGAWHGNDTIWRMIYDLNLVLQCADAEGLLRNQVQRRYLCLIDGLVSGEGNGPLQPLPRETDWLICGDDPFALDTALAFFMGFSVEKVPLLARRSEYLGPDWGRFRNEDLQVMIDGKGVSLAGCGINFEFAPPPGWRSFVER